MHSAAKANDVPFIDTMWQRLQQDLQRDRRSNDKSQHHVRINSDSKIVQEISGGAAAPTDDGSAAEASSGSSSSRKQPSTHAHTEAVKAYVTCEAYGKAFQLMHAMEQLYPGDECCSVYGGIEFFPTSLKTEAQIGAAFEQLQLRKVCGTAMQAAAPLRGASHDSLQCAAQPARQSVVCLHAVCCACALRFCCSVTAQHLAPVH